MRLEVPDIYWHGPKDRILAIAFSPSGDTLITSGTVDSETQKTFMRQWQINYDKGFEQTSDDKDTKKANKNVKYICDLTGGHESTVNCVRFSPNGKYLASCADDSSVIIWTLRRRAVEFGSSQTEITWCPYKILKCHTSDVYDLAWSRDSQYLVSGSIDNSAILWSVERAKKLQILEGHKHFVQGVCLDPKFKYIVTISSDRTARVWKNAKAKKNLTFFQSTMLKKLEYKIKTEPKDTGARSPSMKVEEKPDEAKEGNTPVTTNMYSIFLDENALNTFFRRLDWSPDGSFVLVPAARYKESADSESLTVVYAFRRGDLVNPCFCIPTHGKPALCVKFCPKLFKKDTNHPNATNMFDLPYKMVFAIATTDSILIYSTQSFVPIIMVSNIIGNIHYATLTDISWNGSKVMGVSSSDGYCSFMIFDKNDLGTELGIEEYDEELKSLMFPEIKGQEEEGEEKKPQEGGTMQVEENQKATSTVSASQPQTTTSESYAVVTGGKKKIIPKVISNFH